MDVGSEVPPSPWDGLVGVLPAVVLLPADDKSAPWRTYSSVGKVLPLMRWCEEHVSRKFVLPELPHLDEDQHEAYKEQVEEREEYRRRANN